MRVRLALLVSLLLLAVAPVASWGVVSQTAYAANVFRGVDCTASKVKDSAVCQDKGTGSNPLVGSNGIILKIAQLIAVIAGVVAVIIILYSGFKFITARGDSNAAADARHTLIYALVGLVVIVLAQAIVAFVLTNI